jgi:aryl-alcohol dehydrogenase-like predicted oxidoreductase
VFQGDSENLIGKWFSSRPGKRQDIFIATKFNGIYAGQNQWSFRGDAAYVGKACDKSLKRLGVNYIDLYYPHRLDGSTPVEHIVAEMVKLKELVTPRPSMADHTPPSLPSCSSPISFFLPFLVFGEVRTDPKTKQNRQGKIRHLGLCEVSAATLRRAHAVHPIAAVQVEYSPFSTEIEDAAVGLLAACRELSVAVVAYSPLSRGILSGQVPEAARGIHTVDSDPLMRIVAEDDDEGDLLDTQGRSAAAVAAAGDSRRFFPRFSHDNLPTNLAIVAELECIAADEVGCTVAQLTLAWLLYQGNDIFPIPG